MILVAKFGRLACAIGCLLAWTLGSGPPTVIAAPPENWEVMRVFVRDSPDQISRLVTRHYATVLLDDLARELAEHDNLRKVNALDNAALQDATYVARLEGEMIVSDQSRWQVIGAPQLEPLELGKTTLALRAARGLPSDRSQLLDQALFTAEGSVEVPQSQEVSEHWFGFSVTGLRTDYLRQFSFDLPAAPSARLLLATPNNIALRSPTVVVEKLSSPANLLPAEWPSLTSQTPNVGTQWWVIHLAGVSNFELVVDDQTSNDLTIYKHTLRQTTIDYVASEQALETHGRFTIRPSRSAFPVLLAVSSDLKIEQVSVNGLPVTWQLRDGADSDANYIDIGALTSSDKETAIEVRAQIAISDWKSTIELPKLAVAESYTLDGVCRFLGSNGIVADALLSTSPHDGDTIERLPTASLTDRSQILPNSEMEDNEEPLADLFDSPELIWQSRWLGNAPALQGVLSKKRYPWTARTLTRIGVQAEWLSANCRMRLQAPRLTSNEIRLPIGNGWFIDSVRLMQNSNDIRARVEDRRDAASPVIAITWEDDRDQLDLELEVVAHSPRDSSVDTIDLQLPRLVSLPNSEQIDNYVIEPSSRFTVELGVQQLPYQRSAVDLPAWQQQLLPEQTEHWIFQGVRGQVPPISLVGSSGTYSTQMVTVVSQPIPAGSTGQPSSLSLETTIQCTPLSGSIDRLSIVVPQHSSAHSTQWTLLQTDAEPVQLVVEEVASSRTEPVAQPTTEPSKERSQRVIELLLPNALSTPFTLSSELVVPYPDEQTPLQLPVMGIPLATPGSSIVLLPVQLAANLEATSIELLPPETDGLHRFFNSPSEFLVELLDNHPTASNQSANYRWVAARVDAGSGRFLEINQKPLSALSSWAWTESVHHRLLDNGVIRHECQWLVEAAQSKPIEFAFPSNWHLEEILIDGRSNETQLENGTLRLDLPLGESTLVSMTCVTHRSSPNWLSYSTLSAPVLSIPILESRKTLSVPPSRIQLSSLSATWYQTGATPKLLQRLFPSNWWNWLGLSAGGLTQLNISDAKKTELPVDRSSAQFDPVTGWRLIELPDSLDAQREMVGVWTMLRTALSALTLSLVLILATGFWSVLGRSVRAWWLSIAMSAGALVLAPLWLLPFIQVASLALLLAALFRMGWVACRIGEGQLRPRSRSSIIGPTHNSSTMTLLVLCSLLGMAGKSGQAQPPSAPQANESVESNESALSSGLMGRRPISGGSLGPVSANAAGGNALDQPKEIFGVLIPIDEEGNVSGAYAYAPTRLLELLSDASGSTTGLLPPRITSADYTLRMRRSLLGQPDQLQELSVTLQLNIPQADVELQLPFNNSQLRLLSGNVAGQELFVGGRGLYQNANAIFFRSSSTGKVRLQLQFEPRSVEQTATQATLRCQIPPIPNATMRVVADSNSTFELSADGKWVKNISIGTTELLGPIAQFDLRWSTNALRRNTVPLIPEVYADTWMHARGSQVLALCQVRIAQARNLPRELHLVSEPGWEPIGVDWQDGELIANELSSLGGRRVYTIRCSEGWETAPERVLRVLMAPTQTAENSNEDFSTMSIPFFSLREVSQQSVIRTLAWSAETSAIWRPEGLDYWQELPPANGPEWGDFGWGLIPRLYRIPGTLSASLRRMTIPNTRRVSESTQIHLSAQEIRLRYQGQLTATSQSALALSMPAAARVNSVRVDGTQPNYRISARDTETTLEIIPTNYAGSLRSIEVDISLPSNVNQAANLPRVFLRDWEATSSVVRIHCGTGVICELQQHDELVFTQSTVPPHELLPQLESLIGQVELGNQYRDTPSLPLNFTLQHRPTAPLVGSVIALQRTNGEWRGTVRATWQCDDRPMDFAFFELPLALRDSIDTGKLPHQLVPHGNSNRMTLRVIPLPPIAGKTTVEFGFLLANGTSAQTLSIPQISVVGQRPIRPALALPNSVAGQPIQWIHTGRRLENLPEGLLEENWSHDFQIFDLETSQSQVSWQQFENAQQTARLELCHTTLLKRESQWISGFADYWIQPAGQVSLTLSIPETCDVLGVEIGGESALWQVANQQLTVLLQPSSLPLNMRLVLHWRRIENQADHVSLPKPLNASLTSDAWQGIDNHIAGTQLAAAIPATSNLNTRAEIARRWGGLLADVLRNSNDRSGAEFADWLNQWQPEVLGLDNGVNMRELMDGAELDALLANGITTADRLAPSSLWDLLQAKYELDQGEEPKPAPLTTTGQERATRMAPISSFLGKQSTTRQQLVFESSDFVLQHLELNSQPTASLWVTQWTAAALLSLAALLIVVLAWRLASSYSRLLANQPWIYWLQLAALAWFILPARWPSVVLALTALTMLFRYALEFRRRSRLLARV